MPIYEYRCLGCGANVEKMQKVSDEPLKVCDECGGAMEKQWSLSGFQFKGGGWYVTDYAGKTKGDAASATITDKADTAHKADKSEGGEKGEKTEKSSPAESTAKAESASNKSNDTNATVSKTETAAKKD